MKKINWGIVGVYCIEENAANTIVSRCTVCQEHCKLENLLVCQLRVFASFEEHVLHDKMENCHIDEN